MIAALGSGMLVGIRQLGVGTSLPFRRCNPWRLKDALHESLHETCAATASETCGKLLTVGLT